MVMHSKSLPNVLRHTQPPPDMSDNHYYTDVDVVYKENHLKLQQLQKSSKTSSTYSNFSEMLRFDFIEQRLSKLFGVYIRFVVKWPKIFIIVPLLLTLVLITGIIKNPPLIRDELSLYTPINAPARQELELLEQYFDIDDTDPFYAQRRFNLDRMGHIIITGHPEGIDVLSPPVLDAAAQLWQSINQLTIRSPIDNRLLNYSDICIKIKSGRNSYDCVQNPLLASYKAFRSDRNATSELLTKLRYPVTSTGWFIGNLLGGISVNDERFISGARALLLPYMLGHSSKEGDLLASEWEHTLQAHLSVQHSPRLRLAWWTSETLSEASANDRDALLTLLFPLFLVLTSFTILCCFVGSWVRSRPWLGLGGVLSAGMSIVSAIGLLLLVDYHFTSVAYSMPFIMFSIGVDNVFLLLSAWRKTPHNLDLADRMSMTFAEAGVSITVRSFYSFRKLMYGFVSVTSLTDGLSFGVGCFATFPSVRVFCVYATVAIVFVYIYQLTFFAGVMVITGRREMLGKHCFSFKVIEQPAGSKTTAWTQNAVNTPVHDLWIAAPETKSAGQADNGQVQPDHYAMNHSLAKFFRTTFADLLLNPIVRILVLTVFVVYLAVAGWGCTKLELGLRPTDLLPANSYGHLALQMKDQYFAEYGSTVHVLITNLTKYDQRRPIWKDLEDEIKIYEHTEFTGYADSWLRVFLAFVNTNGYDLSPNNFVYLLKNIFLVNPVYEKYSRDILFDGSGLKLEAIRVPVQLRFVGVSNQSRAMHMLRRLADFSRMDASVYSDFFLFAEQFDAVLPGTLVNVGMAGAAVILVSLLLIPKPGAALWVSATIVSINIGILGYMSLWGVRLDFVSMVTIVMSIGFCVDFSAHIAYHFAKERNKSAEQRLRGALYAVGTPILQSAASTIIGVSFLVLVDSYVYQSFMKTVVLVVLLGAFHGLVILPVLLTLLFCSNSDNRDYESEADTNVTRSGQVTPPNMIPNQSIPADQNQSIASIDNHQQLALRHYQPSSHGAMYSEPSSPWLQNTYQTPNNLHNNFVEPRMGPFMPSQSVIFGPRHPIMTSPGLARQHTYLSAEELPYVAAQNAFR